MTNIPFEYWNALAGQLIVISSLLGGFSLSLLFTVAEKEGQHKNLFRFILVATASFLVCIFSMTSVLLLTTKGYPGKTSAHDLVMPRIIGSLTFLTGLISMIVVLALSGWNKSKSTKKFAIIVAIITFLLIFAMVL